MNGSCRDTFSLNESAWQRLYANPPTVLQQDYFKCTYLPLQSVINALGVGSGTAGAIAPISVVVLVILIQFMGFRRSKLRHHMYTQREMEKVRMISPQLFAIPTLTLTAPRFVLHYLPLATPFPTTYQGHDVLGVPPAPPARHRELAESYGASAERMYVVVEAISSLIFKKRLI